jgi:2-dehydro-3-deoxyphosphogluconate aldolase/(4S)-4-hydroxy-2-oxoglutarate aldolase
MRPDQFLEIVDKERCSAILRTQKQDAAARAMEAAVRGGFRVIEFTLTIPGALDLIRDFSRRGEVVVGAGTVLTVEEARRAVEHGASFLVSPVVDEAVVREALSLGVAVIPGTHTPTEMLQAYRLGAPFQKLFPAPAGGPAYVKACLAPMPFLRLFPTNGVDASNAAAYLGAGAFAVGFVNSLFEPGDVADGRFERIEERARELKNTVRAMLPAIR